MHTLTILPPLYQEITWIMVCESILCSRVIGYKGTRFLRGWVIWQGRLCPIWIVLRWLSRLLGVISLRLLLFRMRWIILDRRLQMDLLSMFFSLLFWKHCRCLLGIIVGQQTVPQTQILTE